MSTDSVELKCQKRAQSFLERNHPYFASRCLNGFSEWIQSEPGKTQLGGLCEELISSMTRSEMPFDEWESEIVRSCQRYPTAFSQVCDLLHFALCRQFITVLHTVTRTIRFLFISSLTLLMSMHLFLS